MRIYFTASLHGKKEFGDNYKKIVETMAKLGHKVFSEHIVNFEKPSLGNLSKEEAKKNYGKILGEIKKGDVVVAEVSTQSLSVGHELTEAISLNKPVVIMYTGDNRPGLLFGSTYDKLQMCEYKSENLEVKVREALEEATKHTDVRFNFFVSPKILNYLDWVAQKRMIPRSVFLRNLIEKEMKKDKDFKG